MTISNAVPRQDQGWAIMYAVPLNPKHGDTWAQEPIALWRRGLMRGAEWLLILSNTRTGYAHAIKSCRLRHRRIYTFADNAWRVPAGDRGWLFISADGRSSGWSLEWPLLPLPEFVAGDARPQTPEAA